MRNKLSAWTKSPFLDPFGEERVAVYIGKHPPLKYSKVTGRALSKLYKAGGVQVEVSNIRMAMDKVIRYGYY